MDRVCIFVIQFCLFPICIWHQKKIWGNLLYWFCHQFSSVICSDPVGMGHLLHFIVIYYYLLLFPEAYLCCLFFGHLTSLRLNSEWCSALQKLEYLEKKQDWKTQDPLLVSCCKQETHYQNVHWPSLPAVFQLRKFTGEHEYSKTMHIWCLLITSQPHLMPFAGWSVKVLADAVGKGHLSIGIQQIPLQLVALRFQVVNDPTSYTMEECLPLDFQITKTVKCTLHTRMPFWIYSAWKKKDFFLTGSQDICFWGE